MADGEFIDVNDMSPAEIVGEEIDQVITRKDSQKEEKPETKKEVSEKPEKKESKPEKKKVVKKKTTKKKAEKKPKTIIVDEETVGDKWLTIIVSAIAILAIILGVYFIFTSTTTTKEADTVAVVVNGVPIYNSDIDTRLQILQNTDNPLLTREDAINGTINQELVVQEAEKKNFKVTSEETNAAIEASLERSGLKMSDFKKNIADSGLNYDSVLDFYRDNLLTFKFINDTIINNISVSEWDAEQYYKDNTNLFETPERVTVEHILIGFSDVSENDTLDKANAVMKDVNAGRTNFCDLVEQWTDDAGSKDTCGEYTFSRQDPYVPEFIAAGFDMKKNELRLVKTQFGYHIMLKTNELPSGVLNFSEVKESIITLLEQRKTIEKYASLIAELRENAVIEIYTQTGEEVPDAPLMDVVNETPEVAEQPRKDVIKTEKSSEKSFANCVAISGAVMYSVYWAPDNDAQLEIFGDDADSVNTVECDSDVVNNKARECASFGFKAYPSWVIDGKVYQGIQSKARLAEATGCES